MVKIDKAKWRSVLTRFAIVVLVFVLLLEITLVVLLNESDAYALIIESLSNLKYR